MIFLSQNSVFLKCTFSGPQLSRRGLVWYLLNLWKARASRGLDNKFVLKNLYIDQNFHCASILVESKGFHRCCSVFLWWKFSVHISIVFLQLKRIWKFNWSVSLCQNKYFYFPLGRREKANTIWYKWQFQMECAKISYNRTTCSNYLIQPHSWVVNMFDMHFYSDLYFLFLHTIFSNHWT